MSNDDSADSGLQSSSDPVLIKIHVRHVTSRLMRLRKKPHQACRTPIILEMAKFLHCTFFTLDLLKH